MNHPGARELSIAHAAKCITTLRVASRSGSCLIRHKQRPTGVQRPTHEGLEAAPHHTESGEKNTDEPHAALAQSGRLGHLNLLVRS